MWMQTNHDIKQQKCVWNTQNSHMHMHRIYKRVKWYKQTKNNIFKNIPALVRCSRSFLISLMALTLTPSCWQNSGEHPSASQAPTAVRSTIMSPSNRELPWKQPQKVTDYTLNNKRVSPKIYSSSVTFLVIKWSQTPVQHDSIQHEFLQVTNNHVVWGFNCIIISL